MEVNSTFLYNNVTQVSIFTAKINEFMKIIFFVLTIFCFCLFLYFMTVLLIVYFTTPHVRDNSRYILFTHMLINDTCYLTLTLSLLLAYRYNLPSPVPLCYLIISLTATTFRVTPFNLAAMAFERYIAICLPLRHTMLCTAQRTYSIVVMIWLISLFPEIVEFVILSLFVKKDFFSLFILCKQEQLTVHPMQRTLRSAIFIGSLFLVSFVILFTYVKVTLVAWKNGSGRSSASKAGRTLILHTFQLFLSMVALTSTVTESYSGYYLDILIMANFLIFMCFPRLLSPLIYGIRDEVFSKYIKNINSANLYFSSLAICPSFSKTQ